MFASVSSSLPARDIFRGKKKKKMEKKNSTESTAELWLATALWLQGYWPHSLQSQKFPYLLTHKDATGWQAIFSTLPREANWHLLQTDLTTITSTHGYKTLCHSRKTAYMSRATVDVWCVPSVTHVSCIHKITNIVTSTTAFVNLMF